MAMTKKYYEIVAQNFRSALDARDGIPEDNIVYETITMVVEQLALANAHHFELTDDKFNRSKFLELCGVEDK